MFEPVSGANNTTVEERVAQGLEHTQRFVERRLQPEEGKRKLAFLSFSSGTTGRPKVRETIMSVPLSWAEVRSSMG